MKKDMERSEKKEKEEMTRETLKEHFGAITQSSG